MASIIYNNVICSVILRHLDQVSLVSLRLTSKWLASFIPKQRVEKLEVPEWTVLDAVIPKDTILVYDSKEIFTNCFQKNDLDAFKFFSSRLVLRSADPIWYVMMATGLGAYKILEYLLPAIHIDESLRNNAFWTAVYSGSFKMVAWVVDHKIIPTSIKSRVHNFPCAKPKHFGIGVILIRHVISKKMASKWLSVLALYNHDHFVDVATVFQIVPPNVCKKAEFKDLHARVYEVCGHSDKPKRKRQKNIE
jgi:hypothetical protein